MTALEDRVNPTPVITAAWVADIVESNGSPGSGASGVVRLTRDDTSGSLSVGLTYGGTASNYMDYMGVVNAFFGSGSATVDVVLTPMLDSSVEGTETVVVGIAGGFGYTVGSPSSATLNLYDADNAQVSVAVQGSDPTEGGSGTFRITRTGSTSGNLSVSFTVGGTATSGTDYTSFGTGATITAGNSYVDVAVPTLADNSVEGDESVSITITDGGSTYTALPGATASLTITDDPPVIDTGAVNMVEGNSGIVTLTRTGGKLSDSLVVNYSVSGTAASGTDFTSLSGTVTFAASSSTATITIATAHDSDLELNETVVLTFLPTNTYTLAGGALSLMSTNVIVEDAATTFDDNGLTGAIWYEVPWFSVDNAQASQSLALSNFELTIAGEVITTSRIDVSFPVTPVATFAYGAMTGILFDADTSGIVGFPYSDVSANGWVLSAVDATTSAVTTAAIVDHGSATLDFTNASNLSMDPFWRVEIVITYKDVPGASYSDTYLKDFASGATATTLVNEFFNEMEEAGWRVKTSPNGKLLTITGTAGETITNIRYKTFERVNNMWTYNKTLKVPTLEAGSVMTTVQLNP